VRSFSVDGPNTTISTAQSVFGGASLGMDFDSFGGGVFASHNPDFNLTDDFTIELFARWNDVNATNVSPAFAAKREFASQFTYEFYYFNGVLGFLWSTNGSSWTLASVSWTPSQDVWYYLALTRAGNDLKFWVDASQVGSTQSVTGSLFAGTGAFYVGHDAGTNQIKFDGYLEEARVTKGVARTISGIPSAAFPNF